MSKCEYYDICKENHKYHCEHFEELLGAYCTVKKEIIRKNNLDRQLELEQEAKNKYCESVDWKEVIYMLSEDDQKEYHELVKQGGFNY